MAIAKRGLALVIFPMVMYFQTFIKIDSISLSHTYQLSLCKRLITESVKSIQLELEISSSVLQPLYQKTHNKISKPGRPNLVKAVNGSFITHLLEIFFIRIKVDPWTWVIAKMGSTHFTHTMWARFYFLLSNPCGPVRQNPFSVFVSILFFILFYFIFQFYGALIFPDNIAFGGVSLTTQKLKS